MRVLHLLYECRPSGAEVMLKLAAPYWKSWGCELDIVTIGPEEGDYTEVMRAAGYRITREPFPRRVLEIIPWMQRFRQRVRNLQPDIIVNHNETIQPLLAMLCHGIGKGQCRVVHNCFSFSTALRLRKAIERTISRVLNVHQIAISPAVAETEWEEYRNRTEVLENWFDSEYFRPPSMAEAVEARASLGISPSTLVLITVGNGSIVKNYRVIIEALAQIPASRDVLYLQVGGEHPAGTDRAEAARLGQEKRIRFCGPKTDIRPYLWASNIYLMPSKFEGFALSTAEAIAAGVPSVLADIQGLKHFRSLEPQVIFCRNEPAAILESIDKLLSSGRTEDHQASVSVRQRFGLEAGARRYFNAWQSRMERRPK